MQIYKLSKLLLAFCLILLTVACDEDSDQVLKDIIKEDLGYLPVITSFSLSSPSATAVQAGSSLTFDLRYWSEADIREIRLLSAVGDAEPTLIDTFPYESAYSSVSRTDSLMMNYQLPANLPSGTEIRFDAVVINENENSRTRSASLTIN
ncbi:MAG: hypothetical protein ACLFQ0_17310 [Cyclobacteriaceae bacterium]